MMHVAFAGMDLIGIIGILTAVHFIVCTGTQKGGPVR